MLLLIPACSSNQQGETSSAKHKRTISPTIEKALMKISAVDTNPYNYKSSYAQNCNEIEKQIEEIVIKLSFPEELENLFYVCREMMDNWDSPDEDIQSINPYWSASNAVLFHLAELKSDAAIKILIKLFVDNNVWWDGEASLNICNAISRCGEKAIPYLAEIKSEIRGSAPSEIVDCIRKGELYGP
jgi:hypothetical protein